MTPFKGTTSPAVTDGHFLDLHNPGARLIYSSGVEEKILSNRNESCVVPVSQTPMSGDLLQPLRCAALTLA